MTIRGDELIKAAEIIAEKREMKANLACSVKGATMTGISTFAGGVVMGPVGFLAGSILGGAMSYMIFKNKYRSLVEIIQYELTPSERTKLAEHINNAIKDIDERDLINLVALIQAGTAGQLETVIFRSIQSFFQNNTSYSIA